MKRILSVFVILLLAVIQADLASAAHTNFRANLTGAQEVPAVVTNATGTAVLTLTPAGGLSFIVTVNGLSGPITGAHFHLGAAGTNGNVVFDITSRFTGTSATGTWRSTDTPALADSIIAAFLAGRIYVNVHTAANPGGEIRGQVITTSGTSLSATLEGSQEIPAVNTPAKGTAALTLTSVGGVGLVYQVTVNGLTGGPIVGAHFHLGRAGQNGPVIREITNEFKGNTAVGVWRTGTGTGALVDSLIVALLTGRMYLNVHTAERPGGEIRGQINVNAGFGMTAKLDGAQEVPPVTTNAKGTASLTLTEYGLVYAFTVDGLSGPIAAAHFHNAAAGTNGNVVRTIPTANNSALGVWKSNDAEPLTPALLRELLAGNIYINVHTAANPGGEIRGQVLIKAGSGATARLDGLQEVPPLTNNARGTASLVAGPTGVQYEITVTGLSGPITNAHFHQNIIGSIGATGSVVKDIMSTFTGTTASGTWGTTDATTPFTEELRAALVAGKLYLNVHTTANPGGEIRGQVLIDAGTGFKADLTPAQEAPPTTKPSTATGTAALTLTRGGLGFNISTSGLSGPIQAAHFHLGEAGRPGGIVFPIPTANIVGPNLTGYWRTAPAGNLVDSLIIALATGNLYINIHTADNPGGELRGQVYLSEATVLIAFLNGRQENPPVTTNARGSAVAAINDVGISFFGTVDGLSGPIANAHFHNGVVGVNGGVVREIRSAFRNNTVAGLWRPADTQALSNLLLREGFASNLYLNVHTAANPGGEIRGQLVTGAAFFTSVSSRTLNVPNAFALAQNYPNPFNPTTLISYNLPKSVRVKLVIYDLLGQKIRTLVDANETAGVKEVVWDATNAAGVRVASGIYFYQLEAGKDFTGTRRLLLMK